MSPFAEGFARRMAEETLGTEDPVYRMRVMAEFAEDVEGQLIPISAIHDAVGRDFEDHDPQEYGVVLGVDVARFGEDRTVVCAVRGGRLVSVEVWRGADTMESAARVDSLINRWEPALVRMDETGLGSGVVDRTRELGHEVEGVKVGERGSRPDTFANLKAELGWHVRGLFERGEVSIPDRPELVSELAALRYDYDSRQRIRMEQKEAAKSRLGRSPDLADALILALTGGVGVAPEGTSEIAWASPVAQSLFGLGGDPRRVVDEDRRNGWTPV